MKVNRSKQSASGIRVKIGASGASSRNTVLADELPILVRRYRRNSEYGFSIEEAMRIFLVASAGLEDLMEWQRFAGEWLTELVLGELEGDEGKVLRAY